MRFFSVILAVLILTVNVFATEVTDSDAAVGDPGMDDASVMDIVEDNGSDPEVIEEDPVDDVPELPEEVTPLLQYEVTPLLQDEVTPLLQDEVIPLLEDEVTPSIEDPVALSGEEIVTADGDPFFAGEIVFPEYTEEDPLPVMLIESEVDFDNVRVLARSAPVVVIGDEEPDDLLFYGSGWITGTDSSLGRVTLYFPISYKTGYWGVDRNGYLFNVSSSSISGYLEDAYNNSVSASGFSYPRYRISSSSYDYETLYLRPENSNMEIAVQSALLYSSSDLLPYVSIFLLGVIIVCFMKRS